MKINDTRKAIIELIEPYMDKTLSEGCLYENELGNILKIGDKIYINKKGECYFDYIDKKYNDKIFLTSILGGEEAEDFIVKKIGHYDITAVLKYIKECHTVIDVNYIGTKIFIMKDFDEDKKEYVFCKSIPNKPLHLYTEEEDKQLLELLQKLGHQQE